MTTTSYTHPAPPVNAHPRDVVIAISAKEHMDYAEIASLLDWEVAESHLPADAPIALCAIAAHDLAAETAAPAPTSTIHASPSTHKYHFAPSSHRSKRVRYCRICAKYGRERCPHHRPRSVAP